jgi:alpha-L-fucosidase
MNKKVKQVFSWLAAVSLLAGSLPGGMTVQAAEVGAAQLAENNTAAPEAWGALPSPNQYRYQKEELAAFCHFGPNTFNEVEWGESYGNREPADIFRLANDFDAETLVKTLQEAGFKKLIVTAKHHDGFCIWASDYTTYDVASTNYKQGNGDILAEISAACTKYNMDMGLYLSPWDIHEPSYGYYDANGNATTAENDVLDYNEHYNNQLREILGNEKYGNNGHFVEVWMDGAKGSGANAQEYDFQTWFATIQAYEGKEAGYDDDCMLFGAQAYTTVRWIGNELGFANEETWSKSTVDYGANTINSNQQTVGGTGYTVGVYNGNKWTVPEADARITSGWFWGTAKCTPKSLADLGEMYFRSVGHNAPLLLNVPPNNQGTVDTAILNRVKEFGQNIKDSFDVNLAANATVTASEVRGNDVAFSPANVIDGDDTTYWTMSDGTTTGSLTLDLGGTKTFDLVTIEEAIQLGQRISSFSVEYQADGGEWQTFAEGTTIGAKRICRDAAVRADKVRINITGSYAVPLISEVGLYKASEDFEISSPIIPGLEVISVTDTDVSDGKGFTYTGWTAQSGSEFIEGNSMWANSGAEATLKFTGTKVWLYGTKDPSHGTADIYIDGNKVDTINTNAGSRSTGQEIYESADLSDGEHTLQIVNTGTGSQQAIGLDAAAVLNNGGKGMVEFEKKNHEMEEDSTDTVLLKRVGGSTGEISVTYENNPGSAVQGHYDVNGIQGTIVFADGEKEKEIPITTKRYDQETGDLNFTVDLNGVQGGALLGRNTRLNVVIHDLDDSGRIAEAREILTQAQTMLSNTAEGTGIERVRSLAKELNAYLENSDVIAVSDIILKARELKSAMEQVEVTSAFVLPVGEEVKTIEAEAFTLDASEAADKVNKYVRITERSDASGGKEVNWFENGNKIRLAFHAPKAGTYQVTATYRSGRSEGSPNAFEWSGTNVTAGSLDVYGPDANVFKTATFDIVVTQAGEGELVFTASSKAGPVIDKFVIECKDKTPVTTVAVTGVTLDKESISLTAEKPYATLVETITPANATNQNVTFTSSDTTVATVDENGLVRGVPGALNKTATITVTTEDGNKTAECQVTVTFKNENPAEEKLEELNGALKELEAVITAGKGNYTDETWNKLVKAYNSAKAVDEKTDLAVIAQCLKDLQDAKATLQVKQPDPTPVNPDPTPVNPNPTPVNPVKIEVNKIYDSGNYYYKVTSVSEKTAQVTGLKKKDITKIVIYNTVTLGGQKFNVTSVAPSAFKGNKKITSVTVKKGIQDIGANAFASCPKLKKVTIKSTTLKNIGAKAFYNCKKLKSVVIKSKVLKKIGKNAFKGINKKAVFRVPASKLKAYKKTLTKAGLAKTAKIRK